MHNDALYMHTNVARWRHSGVESSCAVPKPTVRRICRAEDGPHCAQAEGHTTRAPLALALTLTLATAVELQPQCGHHLVRAPHTSPHLFTPVHTCSCNRDGVPPPPLPPTCPHLSILALGVRVHLHLADGHVQVLLRQQAACHTSVGCGVEARQQQPSKCVFCHQAECVLCMASAQFVQGACAVPSRAVEHCTRTT